MNRLSKLLLMGMALALMAPAVAAPTLTFKFTAVNIPGAAQVQAYGISESGVIVGEYIGTDSIPTVSRSKAKP
jgi:hypothetical protein